MSLKDSCLKDEAKGSLEITVSSQDCLNFFHHIRNVMEMFKILD